MYLYAGLTGKISGRVTDAKTGEPLAFVNVLIPELKSGAATDLDGYYAILNVPPGIFSLKASMLGYSEMKVTNVKVSIDFTTTINFTLRESNVQLSEVTVIAEKQLVRKDLTSSSSTVSADQIKSMPVESFQDILQLQAGVVVGSGGEIHVRGGRASEVSFMVDGISVTDPYSGGASVEVGSEGIQELKFVSGTFNAEYGQVMSGVVDIVTKDGGSNFNGQISGFAGDYVSNASDFFLGIDKLNPLSINNVQANLSGPVSILSNNLTFFTSVRHDYNEGWMYGKRIFLPSDSSNFDGQPSSWIIRKSGEGAIVPMNDAAKLNLQGKLTLALDGGIKFSYNGIYTRDDYHAYNQVSDHLYKYNPDGNFQHHSVGYTHIGSFTHVLSSAAFYTLKVSNFFSDYKRYVYEDPYDSRYVNPKFGIQKSPFNFLSGGVSMGHFSRNTQATVVKGDYTSQINRVNLIKLGSEFKWNILKMHEYVIQFDQASNYKPMIPALSTPTHNQYEKKPIEGAFYIQDKVEIDDIVLNLGVRYDYFNSQGVVPLDFRDPNGLLKQTTQWSKKASAKQQVSPRLGIAFPITDKGVIHFSYGHFFQIPPYEFLYINPEFEVVGGTLTSRMGNADLNPQKTVIYELGLQQQIFEGVAFDLTGFYKDLRNLLGTEVHETYTSGDSYARYVNLDYGNVRGITMAMQARFSPSLSFTVDYTFQVAEGNASDPDAQFYNKQSTPPRADEIQVLPLDWDQTHTLNFSVNVGDANDWTVGIIGRLESGLPYTPIVQQGIRVEFQNSGRKPTKYIFDLKAQKNIELFGMNYALFLKVYNLLDTHNELKVYDDTGRAGYSLASQYSGDVGGVNTLAEFLNRPDFYSEPRKVLVGFSVGF